MVVLPEPERPITPSEVPRGTSKDRFFRAGLSAPL